MAQIARLFLSENRQVGVWNWPVIGIYENAKFFSDLEGIVCLIRLVITYPAQKVSEVPEESSWYRLSPGPFSRSARNVRQKPGKYIFTKRSGPLFAKRGNSQHALTSLRHFIRKIHFFFQNDGSGYVVTANTRRKTIPERDRRYNLFVFTPAAH